MALSSADKTLHEATNSIAVVAAIAGSGHGAEPPAMLVHAFMRHIEPLAPADRADARAALVKSLALLPEPNRSHAFSVVKHSDALKDIDTLPDHERTSRLAALAEENWIEPNILVRYAMLGNLVDKVRQLPGEHRAEGLTAVVARLAALTEYPAQAVQPFVHDLLALSQALPMDQLGPVPLQLAQKIRAASEPSEAFDRAWHHAMRLAEATTTEQAEQMATLLADKIPSLTTEARHEAFDRTIALIGTLPPSEQSLGNGLECLAKTVHSLPEFPAESANEGRPGRAAALHKIMESLDGVRGRHRASVLNACAAAMTHVTHQREQVFDETLEAIKGLPRDSMCAGGLKALIRAKSTAHDGPGNELSKILQSLDGLGAYERADVVLVAARAFRDIGHPGSLPLLVLDQISGLLPSDQGMTLKEIFENVRWTAMSSEDLARNAHAALSALSHSPMDYSSSDAAKSAAFNLPILTMEAGARAAIFAKLLQQAERTPEPDEHLLEILSRKIKEAHDMTLQLQVFAPLLRLAGAGDHVALDAMRHLADQLVTLPDTELQTAWHEMRALVDRALADRTPLTPFLDQVIAGLAENLPRLGSQSQGEALAWVQQSIPQLFKEVNNLGSESKALLKLASAIPALPEDLRLSAFDTTLTHVATVLAADNRADSDYLIDHDDGRRQMHRDERGAALLAQLAEAAGSLPKLAPRAAVSQILAGLQNIGDDASRANVLKSLARDALPAALERPVKFGMRASDPLKRHVSREVLLQGFVRQVERLPPESRVAALQEMLEDARAAVHAIGESARSRDDKSAKLPALLEGLLQKAEAALRA